MQTRRLTGTIACVLLAGAVTGCGGTYIRIGKPPALRSDRETQLIARPPVAYLQSPSAPATPPTDPAPTPLERAPGLAAEPPSAAPLPLAASPGQGQGEGLPEPPPPPPVTRTLPLAEALRLLATKAGVTSDVQIAGSPTVEVTGEPSGNLAADLAALMGSVRPAHYAAIGIDHKGTPIRLFISPYPIVGAGQ